MQSDVLVRVLLGDPSPLIAGRYLADGYVQLISASSSEYCEDLLAKCVASDVDLVIPVFDGEFAALAAARPQFESAGVRVAIASPEAIAQCRDKHKTGELFARLGLGRPTTYSESEARSLSADAYPLFLKPADGRGSLGIARVDFPADLDRHLTTMEAPVIQECIEGADISEITIDCLSDLDGNFVACLPRERQVIKAGQSYKGLSFRDAEIESACRLLCEALHLAGPSCIQCFRTPEGPLFIEINPRFGAASVLAMAAGLNGPAYLACQVANKTPAVPAPRSGIQMLRYWQEVFVDLEQDVALDAVKLR
tara:strand:+ start:14905 stop:15834 length:930 start_codon:yes stop_codon:yes gene_type:complete